MTVNFLPILVLRIIGGLFYLGLYSMTLRLIATPVNAFSGALRSIYWRWLVKNKLPFYFYTKYFFSATLISGTLISLIFLYAQFPIAEVLLGANWKKLDFFIPYAMLWLTSSLSAVFPTEVLKNSSFQKTIFLGELFSGTIKFMFVMFFVFIKNVELLLLSIFLIGYLTNVMVSISYIFKIKRNVF